MALKRALQARTPTRIRFSWRWGAIFAVPGPSAESEHRESASSSQIPADRNASRPSAPRSAGILQRAPGSTSRAHPSVAARRGGPPRLQGCHGSPPCTTTLADRGAWLPRLCWPASRRWNRPPRLPGVLLLTPLLTHPLFLEQPFCCEGCCREGRERKSFRLFQTRTPHGARRRKGVEDCMFRAKRITLKASPTLPSPMALMISGGFTTNMPVLARGVWCLIPPVPPARRSAEQAQRACAFLRRRAPLPLFSRSRPFAARLRRSEPRAHRKLSVETCAVPEATAGPGVRDVLSAWGDPWAAEGGAEASTKTSLREPPSETKLGKFPRGVQGGLATRYGSHGRSSARRPCSGQARHYPQGLGTS